MFDQIISQIASVKVVRDRLNDLTICLESDIKKISGLTLEKDLMPTERPIDIEDESYLYQLECLVHELDFLTLHFERLVNLFGSDPSKNGSSGKAVGSKLG